MDFHTSSFLLLQPKRLQYIFLLPFYRNPRIIYLSFLSLLCEINILDLMMVVRIVMRSHNRASIVGFFYAGIKLFNPAAQRAAPSGICGRTALAATAPLLKYVKDLTPSDTLVNCTYLLRELLPDSVVPGNPYSLWISIGLNAKKMEHFERKSSIISLVSVKLAQTDVSDAKIHADSLHLPNIQD
jgi:hypothetical protein